MPAPATSAGPRTPPAAAPETGFIDTAGLARIDGPAIRAALPYPHAELEALLTPAGYALLQAHLPPPASFAKVFGRRRRHGQQSHDRYVLQHRPSASLPAPWRRFIRELEGPSYRRFVAALLGHDDFLLHFHWHYTPRGCSVSPHCDAPWKLGSHIFYLNTAEDWDLRWGGETVILGDERRFPAESAPAFEDFSLHCPSTPMGNRSLVFLRTENSWHGVRALQCPEGALRKVFIVEFRARSPLTRIRTLVGL